MEKTNLGMKFKNKNKIIKKIKKNVMQTLKGGKHPTVILSYDAYEPP